MKIGNGNWVRPDLSPLCVQAGEMIALFECIRQTVRFDKKKKIISVKIGLNSEIVKYCNAVKLSAESVIKKTLKLGPSQGNSINVVINHSFT